jgi:hypothetical protein
MSRPVKVFQPIENFFFVLFRPRVAMKHTPG